MGKLTTSQNDKTYAEDDQNDSNKDEDLPEDSLR